MEKKIDMEKLAVLTGRAVQDDELFKSEGGFVPERDQFYFEMKQGDNVFLIGAKDILICLRVLAEMGEIPKISEKWWDRLYSLYGDDIFLYENDGSVAELSD